MGREEHASEISLDDVPVMFFNRSLITDWSDASMLIADADARLRQGTFWPEQGLEHGGKLPRTPNDVFSRSIRTRTSQDALAGLCGICAASTS
jgi:hypothetical protein